MKYPIVLLIFILISSCTKFEYSSEDPVKEVEEYTVVTTRSNGDANGNFKSHLSGMFTKATGQVNFKFNDDNSKLYYKLIVANIKNVTAAHLHHSHMGEQPGHPVLTLFSGFAEGRTNGILMEGYLTDADINCTCSNPTHHNLTHLRGHIEDRETTVLVHTLAFPAGEISGRVR